MHKNSVLKATLQSVFVGFLLLVLMAFKGSENSESFFTVTPASITETDQTVCFDNIVLINVNAKIFESTN